MMKSALVFITISLALSHVLSECPGTYFIPPVGLRSTCEESSAASRQNLLDEITEITQEISRRKHLVGNCLPNETTVLSTSHRDCQDVANIGEQSGAYSLVPVKRLLRVLDGVYAPIQYSFLVDVHERMTAYCDIVNDIGWTVIMRRINRTVSFNRTMVEYKEGFGNPQGDYWLGLDNIHHLVSQPFTSYTLWVVITDRNGVQYNFPYKNFKIEGESTQYKLVLGEYTGRLTDQMEYSNRTTFNCWESRPSGISRHQDYYGGYRLPCFDRGNVGSGCWWFRAVRSRYCGMNNLHDTEPFWHGISIQSVLMKIKRD